MACRDHTVVQRRGWAGWLNERRIGYSFVAPQAKGGDWALDVGEQEQWEAFCRDRTRAEAAMALAE